MPRALPPDSDGSMTAMAKGVNDVLNYYVQVTDTKASIFIAGSVAAASFLLLHFPDGLGARLLYFSAASCLGASPISLPPSTINRNCAALSLKALCVCWTIKLQ